MRVHPGPIGGDGVPSKGRDRFFGAVVAEMQVKPRIFAVLCPE